MALHDERCRRDISEQQGHRQTILHDIRHIAAVTQDAKETCTYLTERPRLTARRGEGFAEAARNAHQQQPHNEKEPKYALPAGYSVEQPACHRSCHRSHTIDGTYNCQHSRQFTGRITVCCHRAGQHYASGPSQPLYKT